MRGTVRLGIVFAVLVGVNVYVFLFSPGSIHHVSKVAQEAQTRGEAALAPAPPPDSTPTRASVARKVARGTVREGDSLGSILRREGLEPPDSDHLIRALQPVLDFRTDLRTGGRYVIRYDDEGRLESFELTTSVGRWSVERGDDGALQARKRAG